jgi:aspartokinase
MSELVVGKAGGTSNRDAETVALSLEWAEQVDIFVASAPGKLDGWSQAAEDAAPDHVIPESKVTDMLLAARRSYAESGSIPSRLTDMITGRYELIARGLGSSTLPASWHDRIPARIEEATSISADAASRLGEKLQWDILISQGFTPLDPGRAPHDLESDPEAWRGWLSAVFKPGQRHVLVGNTTRIDGQVRTFSRGGSDTSGGFAAYGIQADLNLNLTDGGAKSADPRVVGKERVRHLDHLLYLEGRELGRNGTGLVHPDAMTPLAKGNIPTEIRSTFDRDAPFTRLDNDFERAENRAGRVAALSLMENVVVHRIYELGMAGAVGRLAAFETALAEQGIALIDAQGAGVDGHEYFAHSADSDLVAKTLRATTDGGIVEEGDETLITLVGYKLRQHVIDNIFDLALNSGMRGKLWQSEGRPLSTGPHSLRVGVNPESAREILSRIHSNSIELSRRGS